MRTNLTTPESDIWVLLDNRAGNRAQALGVAERMNVPYKPVELIYGPFISLPNIVLGASLRGVTAETKNRLVAPWPKLVIAAGRRTAPVARWIKRQSGDKTRLVQIMDPGCGQAAFDLICRPLHDGSAPAANILDIPAAPHGLNAEKLKAVASIWHARLSHLPSPRIALLIGGSTRRRYFSPDMARQLCVQASAIAADLKGSLMVTTSRRTGDAINAIEASLSGAFLLHRWDDEAENPYVGYLATADAIIVTGESVSMCSEAVSTGKPVYIFAPPALITPKHARLHKALIDGGHAMMLGDNIDLSWKPLPLNAADDIVSAMSQRNLLQAT